MEVLEPNIKIEFNLSNEEKFILRSACGVIRDIENLIKKYLCDHIELKDYETIIKYNANELSELRATLYLIANCDTTLHKEHIENQSIK